MFWCFYIHLKAWGRSSFKMLMMMMMLLLLMMLFMLLLCQTCRWRHSRVWKETQQSVKEGDSVSLRCKSSCSLPQQTTFIWYRNTQILTDQTENLHLQSVKRSDAGNYKCEISGNNHHLISPAVYLNVECEYKWFINISEISHRLFRV